MASQQEEVPGRLAGRRQIGSAGSLVASMTGNVSGKPRPMRHRKDFLCGPLGVRDPRTVATVQLLPACWPRGRPDIRVTLRTAGGWLAGGFLKLAATW